MRFLFSFSYIVRGAKKEHLVRSIKNKWCEKKEQMVREKRTNGARQSRT
jgi:hypothetical protein